MAALEEKGGPLHASTGHRRTNDHVQGIFSIVFDYLRDGSTELLEAPNQLRPLLKEARFYDLGGLEEPVQVKLACVAVHVP